MFRFLFLAALIGAPLAAQLVLRPDSPPGDPIENTFTLPAVYAAESTDFAFVLSNSGPSAVSVAALSVAGAGFSILSCVCQVLQIGQAILPVNGLPDQLNRDFLL